MSNTQESPCLASDDKYAKKKKKISSFFSLVQAIYKERSPSAILSLSLCSRNLQKMSSKTIICKLHLKCKDQDACGKVTSVWTYTHATVLKGSILGMSTIKTSSKDCGVEPT